MPAFTLAVLEVTAPIQGPKMILSDIVESFLSVCSAGFQSAPLATFATEAADKAAAHEQPDGVQ
jgi:hypothetical protein